MIKQEKKFIVKQALNSRVSQQSVKDNIQNQLSQTSNLQQRPILQNKLSPNQIINQPNNNPRQSIFIQKEKIQQTQALRNNSQIVQSQQSWVSQKNNMQKSEVYDNSYLRQQQNGKISQEYNQQQQVTKETIKEGQRIINQTVKSFQDKECQADIPKKKEILSEEVMNHPVYRNIKIEFDRLKENDEEQKREIELIRLERDRLRTENFNLKQRVEQLRQQIQQREEEQKINEQQNIQRNIQQQQQQQQQQQIRQNTQIEQQQTQQIQSQNIQSSSRTLGDQIREIQELRSLLFALRMQSETIPLLLMSLGGGRSMRAYISNESGNYVQNFDSMSYEDLINLGNNIGQVNRGLTREQIKRIPKIRISHQYRTMIRNFPDSCSICLNNFQIDEKVKKLGCNHHYHSKCIKTWLLQEKRCPICKREVEVQ